MDQILNATSLAAVVVVDPVSTGSAIAESVLSRGFKVVRLWSNACPPNIRSHTHTNEDTYAATLSHSDVSDDDACTNETLERMKAKLSALPFEIVAVICGCDTGVAYTNALAEHMHMRGNPRGENAMMERVRSNKYYQQEALRSAGARAVKQRLARTEADVREFLDQLAPSPFNVIVKPVESAGSDDVKLCLSTEDAVAHFQHIVSKKVNAVGKKNEAALVQEYLAGTEYIVDFVSRDGCHKCVAIWEYDKRKVNGAPAVYFGEWPLSGDHPLAVALAAYTKKVLDACGITNGATHTEVIVNSNGEPCLVECNCRANGGDGLWLPVAESLYGYSQVSALLDSYLDAPTFDKIPMMPPTLTRAGVVGHLVSYQDGLLVGTPGMEKIQTLASHVSTTLAFNIGDHLPLTIDFLTDAGTFLLCHEDPVVVESDYKLVHEFTGDCAFFAVHEKSSADSNNSSDAKSNDLNGDIGKNTSSYSEREASDNIAVAASPAAVVVVDPVSTGSAIAESVLSRGLKVVRLWSNACPPNIRSHTHTNEDTYAATLSHSDVSDDDEFTIETLERMKAELDALPLKIVAVICGCDTGVAYTNALAEHMDMRGNPRGENATMERVRSNKYYQQEALRSAGARAVKQRLAKTKADVREFLNQLAPSPFQVIVKPVESAGSDDVKLCLSMEDAVAHFQHIVSKKVNAVGKKNEAALVQEYLAGTEYIVDFVSRDGCHKCVAIWEYDKRKVNGAPAVYFGEWPLGGDHPLAVSLAAYTQKVLDACGISNGATHTEVIVNPNGEACLVECNCRANGGDGLWLPVAESLYGYSQVSALLDAYLDSPSFDKIPMMPPTLTRAGVVGHLVSYQDGLLVGTPGMEKIQRLASHVSTTLAFNLGDTLPLTIDFLTDAGTFLLCHEDPVVVESDYKRVHEFTDTCVFFAVRETSSADSNDSTDAESDDLN